LALGLVFAVGAPLAAKAAAPVQGTPEQFVQAFYDWYVPLSIKNVSKRSESPADIIAIRQRPALFGRELAAMLVADWRMQSKCRGYIVGLDFDPFLQAQDDDGHFRVAGAKATARGYQVLVSRDGKPFLSADVAGGPGHWRFTDFSDHDGQSLIATLRGLAKSDQTCPKD